MPEDRKPTVEEEIDAEMKEDGEDEDEWEDDDSEKKDEAGEDENENEDDEREHEEGDGEIDCDDVHELAMKTNALLMYVVVLLVFNLDCCGGCCAFPSVPASMLGIHLMHCVPLYSYCCAFYPSS